MSYNLFVSEVNEIAQRTQSNCRRKLRRWLSKRYGLPTHFGMATYHEWIEMDLDSLIAEVEKAGGDPDAIIIKAKEEVVNWISEGK